MAIDGFGTTAPDQEGDSPTSKELRRSHRLALVALIASTLTGLGGVAVAVIALLNGNNQVAQQQNEVALQIAEEVQFFGGFQSNATWDGAIANYSDRPILAIYLFWKSRYLWSLPTLAPCEQYKITTASSNGINYGKSYIVYQDSAGTWWFRYLNTQPVKSTTPNIKSAAVLPWTQTNIAGCTASTIAPSQ